MKQLVHRAPACWTTTVSIALLGVTNAFAQMGTTTTTHTTTTTMWFSQWWLWAAGAGVFLIVVIALTTRGRGKESS